MSNPNKAKGDRAERTGRDYLRAHGFPGTERTRAGYTRDAGDLHLSPGVIAQVKDCRTLRWREWLAELAEQALEAQADIGLLIVKRPGMGDPGQWLAVTTVERMTELLRGAGYGTPPD